MQVKTECSNLQTNKHCLWITAALHNSTSVLLILKYVARIKFITRVYYKINENQ